MKVPQTFEIIEAESIKIERYLDLLQRCETVLTRAMDRASIRDGRALLDDLRKELGK